MRNLKIYRDYQNGITIHELIAKYELSDARIRDILCIEQNIEDTVPEQYKDDFLLLRQEINQLDCGMTRKSNILKCLLRAEIYTVEQLRNTTKTEVALMRGMGTTSLKLLLDAGLIGKKETPSKK